MAELKLEDVQWIVNHLIHDGTRDGILMGDLLNKALGASARRRAAEETVVTGGAIYDIIMRQGILAPGDPEKRMDAYYYSFERTGVGIIDDILSAVAVAGKAYHHTESWSDTDEYTPVSHTERIQQAAHTAAEALRDLQRATVQVNPALCSRCGVRPAVMQWVDRPTALCSTCMEEARRLDEESRRG